MFITCTGSCTIMTQKCNSQSSMSNSNTFIFAIPQMWFSIYDVQFPLTKLAAQTNRLTNRRNAASQICLYVWYFSTLNWNKLKLIIQIVSIESVKKFKNPIQCTSNGCHLSFYTERHINDWEATDSAIQCTPSLFELNSFFHYEKTKILTINFLFCTNQLNFAMNSCKIIT